MRLPALALPVVLAVAGAGYFLAKSKENPGNSSLKTAPAYTDERSADAEDAAIIAGTISSRDLTEEQSNALVTAAGRRYMRRKLAWMEGGQQAGVASLKHDMDAARRVYDLAESLGRKTRLIMASAKADIEMEQLLARNPSGLSALVDRHIGHNTLTDGEIEGIESAFLQEFGRPLPVSARGASAMHRAMGFDHTGRVDVAVNPGGSEGLWLRRHLIGKGISFFAFRGSAAGSSTGAHIHIGPASGRAH